MAKLLRLIDANLNRSLEGLRVCEDVARFVMDDRWLSRRFKSLRHKVGCLAKKTAAKKAALLLSRNVKKDVGRKTLYGEKKRKDIKDVFCVNLQRVKESLRVLEEATKLFDARVSEGFKKVRFGVYELEKKSRLRLETLLHSG